MRSTVVWIRSLVLLALAGAGGALLVLAACYLYLAPQLPAAGAIREVEYQIPLRIYTSDHKLIAEYGEKRREPITYEEVPEPFIQAVLAAEDERFFEHPGVDPKGLLRAAVELLRYQEIRSGGSTITMQVARNFFLDREQRFLRKFNEIVLAIQIERILEKEEILELYLNKIYLGHRAYGAEAAAQVYYGESIKDLSLPQWAMIAGLPKAPSAYNPITNPERARQRRNWILFRMEETGAIDSEQRKQAQAAPVTARYHAARPEVEGAYMGEVARVLAEDLVEPDLYTEGLRIITTLNSKRQNAAVTALRQGLHAYDERHGWRGPLARIDAGDLPELGWPAERDTEAAPDTDQPEPEMAQEKEPDLLDELDEDLAAWVEQFKDQADFGPLRTAAVTAVRDRQAAALLRDGKQVVLDWDAIRWARPALNKGYVGEAPQTAADVLAPGDVIYVRPDGGGEDDPSWRLAQLPVAQSALISLNPDTGAVEAMQGGYSFYASKFNRALQARRQAGSVFKPFIYTAALESGFTPATIINDAPLVFDDDKLKDAWRPTGASDRFYGPTRLREALYRSLNLVSIRILRQVGISQAMNTLDRFGLPTKRFQRDLSLALGSASVTPLEIARAYSVFANGGYRVDPWFIERIEDKDGKVLWKAPRVERCEAPCAVVTGDSEVSAEPETDDDGKPIQPPPTMAPRVIDENTAWLMHSILQDVVKRGTGSDARRLGRSDLAGKTGTTNDQVDAWFSGYSPELVATVWVGFDNPASLGNGEYGGRAALPTWIDYMGVALEGVEEVQPPQPPGVVSVRIDPDSGLQARPENEAAIFEYFREDNVPELEAPHSGDGRSPEQIF
ncbi:MAG: penicillin-binding protein 1A [Pseudomonadota bacterium]|nr:penicillin-binding protein 1A [Pseudomonadota bacterium]